ncbi:uncharacterized protein SCHCODRAFT_02643075 [Schizophyllum commune H4-8]|uniref:uncharacterized protein n=1 Tax=Schizophyllum commune (strain H4-8 / FGSC 9210) TaxID=578458 RepID=UPI0021602775|nr:uncharacterized protein SCHCODRAFT_02643075 [Schizophyllum commune H4-8]KAI5886022.1 hypothetical protein SCHCODRAFT_02643075 [Schizophyllum commune H4-8]
MKRSLFGKKRESVVGSAPPQTLQPSPTPSRTETTSSGSTMQSPPMSMQQPWQQYGGPPQQQLAPGFQQQQPSWLQGPGLQQPLPLPPQQQQSPPPQNDSVSGEQYRYALTNFRIAHEKVEQQRLQLEEQERQVAALRARIALLEGGPATGPANGTGNTVDDFSIRSAAAHLDKLINRWASDVLRAPPCPQNNLARAVLADLSASLATDAAPLRTHALLRHALAEAVAEGALNTLAPTNSPAANAQLTRLHAHLLARAPPAAAAWRRLTFSAAVTTYTPTVLRGILAEHVPALSRALLNKPLTPADGDTPLAPPLPADVLIAALDFARMLHGGAAGDAFYRAFVPEVGAGLHPGQMELVKRCGTSERGGACQVGATVFPGLVKVGGGGGEGKEEPQVVVRRAQVICECALSGGAATPGT